MITLENYIKNQEIATCIQYIYLNQFRRPKFSGEARAITDKNGALGRVDDHG